jgi:tetratricopeptide (TPR) repeat protein
MFLFFVLLLSVATPAVANDCVRAQQLTKEAGSHLPGDLAGAEGLLSAAMALCEGSVSIRFNLGLVKAKLGKNGEARVYLEQAVRAKPDYAKAHNALAQVYISSGEQDKALKHAQIAVDLEPENRSFNNTLIAAMDVDVPPITDAKHPDAVAVVIGNMSYKDPFLAKAPVEYAINDAKVVKEYLVQAMGFDLQNIIYIENAGLADFIKVFGDDREHKAQLFNRVREGASKIFFFYSGHGAPDTNTKKAFVVPVDADPTIIRLTGYSLDTLNNNIDKIATEKKVGEVVVAMDACFSGGYNDGMLIEAASPIFIEVDGQQLKSEKTAVITSSRKDQISSWYRQKQHGLFTYFFLKGIKDAANEGRTLTAGDVEHYLLGSEKVSDHAWRLYNREQTPQVTGNKGVVLFKP